MMRILVVIGDCIKTNSSANLCHISYLNGLAELGHEISLLSCDEKDYIIDNSFSIPNGIKNYKISAISFYQKLSIKKQDSTNTKLAVSSKADPNHQSDESLIKRLKSFVLSMYGVYGITSTFIKKSMKFKSDTLYDFVISIAYPAVSHKATYRLIKSGKIKAKHWIQIWEDPWYSDVYGYNRGKKILREEKKLIGYAEKVFYVSPLTLENQRKLFPEFADKMCWQPLPYYYMDDSVHHYNLENNSYGYFGDYVPISRDLKPFYEAAKKCKVKLNICGKPNNLFESDENITIYPRLPLEQLKPIEEKTNVLVFLCNRQGGQIPGKIYQYSATDKTILFILDGTDEEKKVLKSFFEKFNRYVFCENTVEDICRAINDIENNRIGKIVNKPLEDFAPKRIIENILNGKNG